MPQQKVKLYSGDHVSIERTSTPGEHILTVKEYHHPQIQIPLHTKHIDEIIEMLKEVKW